LPSVCKRAKNAAKQFVDPPIFGNWCFFGVFAAFSARLQTLSEQLKFWSTQTNGPGNKRKMASEGLNLGTSGGVWQRRRRRAPTKIST